MRSRSPFGQRPWLRVMLVAVRTVDEIAIVPAIVRISYKRIEAASVSRSPLGRVKSLKLARGRDRPVIFVRKGYARLAAVARAKGGSTYPYL